MLLADEDQEDMEHEPMRTDSTGDITLVQPMGSLASDITANTQQHQEAYINNSSGINGQPMFPPHLWYQYVAALNPQAYGHTYWGNMGNGSSASSHNMTLSVDGVTYDLEQAKQLFGNMKDELLRTQVSDYLIL